VLTPFFGKTSQKRGKEKRLMKKECNRLIEGERRIVTKTRRWSEESNPDSGPVGQNDRPMVS
jgi:hypothetical protein